MPKSVCAAQRRRCVKKGRKKKKVIAQVQWKPTAQACGDGTSRGYKLAGLRTPMDSSQRNVARAYLVHWQAGVLRYTLPHEVRDEGCLHTSHIIGHLLIHEVHFSYHTNHAQSLTHELSVQVLQHLHAAIAAVSVVATDRQIDTPFVHS